ncbi:MAG: hypothetical protein A2431_03600 [Candidatus Zambryskibacteria bacterium RIFOXYC1_FULL_39_10]|uniref:Uncharacterized protein n=1 Tax=Candidatus Zambryskibacteria bacterium RIFOXYC1_FULL_39_10 TaxID=1802779 RepID=A0A1G2UYL8_9BACT|nr:MAG: hypothetical protein A2431_03600 [Candidatus Zambryskibacteria bacterium RIFOXYC1_FULL_39_10]OHB16795.1 MAG: hypothetical protein A2605_01250 [Candidatus Zambryskibacteria bacterium RIFOXYD1_FULL_39_35]
MQSETISPRPLIGLIPIGIPRPSHILLRDGDSVIGGFGKHEIELTAGRIVRFMVEVKNDFWAKFTLLELNDFYKRKGWNPSEILDGLTGAWVDMASIFTGANETDIFLVSFLDGKFAITEEFVRRCAGENGKNVRR